MRNRFLSVLAACAVLFGMAGCQFGELEELPEAADGTVGTTGIDEATLPAETETSAEADSAADDGNPVYPLPEGWTFEKVCNLFEIDGVPLSLDFDVADFEAVNDKINLHEDEGDGQYNIMYYEDEWLLSFQKNGDEPISFFSFGYLYSSDEVLDKLSFAGFKLTEMDEIYDYLDENFPLSYENSVTKSREYTFEKDGLRLKLDVSRWEESDPDHLLMWLYVKKPGQ